MDAENPVIKLCAEGMALEARGYPAEAARTFLQAWEIATDDYDASIAAHYVARHQDSLAESLRWNQISLERANLVSEEKVAGFYPSLYLNLGKANEDLGNREEAKRFYDLAVSKLNVLSDDRYGDIVRDAVQRGLQRLSESEV